MKKKFKAILSRLNPYRNIFFLVSIVFIVWMLFFDANSWMIHKVLDEEIEVLELKKDFYNKKDMNNIKIVEATTQAGFRRNSFIYDFMSSMRQKINDPLGVRAKKRKEISQR